MIEEREDATREPLSTVERNVIFQDLAVDESGHIPGRGYMKKSSNSNEDLLQQLKEQNETNEKLTVLVEELRERERKLKDLVIEERATRERQMESQMELIQEQIRQSVREQLRGTFRERI